MIAAGESRVFSPCGRGHLALHPGNVYLQDEVTPAVPTACGFDFSQDLLRAFQGVTIKEQPEVEGWLLKECSSGEEEFYFNGKIVVWSKSSGYGVQYVHKSFTLDTPVNQVLWTDFNLCNSKPRRMKLSIEIAEDKSGQSVTSGLCAIQLNTISIFTKSGEDYNAPVPFPISKAWSTKYGLIIERNTVNNSFEWELSSNAPVIFSMFHPLNEIAPVLKKVNSKMSYFSESSEKVVFASCDPSILVTFSVQDKAHRIWKLRTTSFEEADYACSKTLLDTLVDGDTPNSEVSSTPRPHNGSRAQSRMSSFTPSNTCSPFTSCSSSRVASPSVSQPSSMSPAISNLTHMATLSRSPSVSSVIHKKFNFTPYAYNASQHSICSAEDSPGVYEFMDSLAPDLCCDQTWVEPSGKDFYGEAASKVFIHKDCTGAIFLGLLLKKEKKLKLFKFAKAEDLALSSECTFKTHKECELIHAIDAECLPALNMILILEKDLTLRLYTGDWSVSKVLIGEIFSPFPFTLSFANDFTDSSLFGTPRRQSIVTSTRPATPMNVQFGDEVLSPLVGSEPVSRITSGVGTFKALRDAVGNRVNLETSKGIFRISMPKVAESKIVLSCLRGLSVILPYHIYYRLFSPWYRSRNAPGPCDVNSHLELYNFLMCVLRECGYDTEGLCMGGYNPNVSKTAHHVKRQKFDATSSDEDWHYMLSSNFHNTVFMADPSSGMNFEVERTFQIQRDRPQIKVSTPVILFLPQIMSAIHLVYEDCKLNVMTTNDLPLLASFLYDLAREMKLELYMDHYWQDYPKMLEHSLLTPLVKNYYELTMHDLLKSPPCIYSWIINLLQYDEVKPFFYIPDVTVCIETIVLTYILLMDPEMSFHQAEKYLIKAGPFSTLGIATHDDSWMMSLTNYFLPLSDSKKAAIAYLTKLGVKAEDMDILPFGLSLMIRNAMLHSRHEPSSEWQEDAFNFIGRQDLLTLHLSEKGKKPSGISKSKTTYDMIKQGLAKDCDDGFQYLDVDVIMLCMRKDLRLCDVCHMLQSSKPVRIALQQRPEVSDHEFIEEQERHLYSLCIRTMSLPIGRGMLTLRSYTPVVTEQLPIPKLCLTGRAPPRNTTVDLSHIDIPPNMNMWPLFHNGVAAGLRVAPSASQIDSTWIVYNKPRSSSNDTPTEHAGFLMALGLNGHLANLSTMSIHDYLCKGHELTSVGVLIGISAAKRGTMDLGASKMLSIHIEALLPLHSTELDVPPVVQVAAVMGVGLLYQGSANHHMSEVMLGEIGRPPGPEMEHCVDRESYSLAAGLALGLITFGKGSEVSGLTDLPMADQLYRFMVGGHKRLLTGVHKEKHKSPSYQIREGDSVNIDVTSPGATLALGMMFFDTNNQSVADWMSAPDTQFLLDMVRPDFLLLRTLSKGLILWASVHPSKEWIEAHVPEIVAKHAFRRNVANIDVGYETMSQTYCNIIAGCCLCLGLKFAGSANNEAYETLMHYARFFLSLTGKAAGEQAGKSTIETCLNVSVLALSMVMAGTGDLHILRLCRHLRTRTNQNANCVLYGSHLATHMAIGLLFLGAGRFTLNTSPMSIGALLCAFYPKFPTHSNDNRYYLQAFYHLYVLATEPRLIIPRLLDSHRPIYTHIHLFFKDTQWYKDVEFKMKAPCLLPELRFLKKVTIEDSRYWPIVFDHKKNWDVLVNLLKNGGNLYLKQKAGCLPYTEDPQGFRSLMAQSFITSSVHGWNIKNISVSKFSSDPLALQFAEKFLQTGARSEREKMWQQKVCSLLFECASQEKMEILPIYIMMIQMVDNAFWKHESSNLMQVNLMKQFNVITDTGSNLKPMVRSEITTAICKSIEKKLRTLANERNNILFHYLTEGISAVIDDKEGILLAGFLKYFQISVKQSKQVPLPADALKIPEISLRDLKFSPSTVLALTDALPLDDDA